MRKALGAAGPGVLVTRAPGYLLAVGPDRVDAGRFHRLVAEARRLADRGAWAAAARFEEALALWRGPPLADFAYQDFAQPEITRLDEARLAATEGWIDAQLAEGRHAELVGELERLVAANPLRERLRGQLILALYRSGRQADALGAYRDARSVLEQELGLDPSPALRDLEQAILRQDAALALPARPRTGPRHNLPARLTSFVGRQAELQQLRKLLERHRLVTLTGPGGAGKSSLALELGGSLVDTQPAGVWLVELASVGEEPALAEAVAAALGIRQGPHPGATGTGGSLIDRVIDYLRANELLLVLDNCEHLVGPCARLADRLLRAVPGLTILATSRQALRVAGEVVWPTPPLQLPDQTTPPELLAAYDALRLFEERAAAARPGFQLRPETTPVVADVCRRLDGLPLAIELAAARLGALPLAELAARLQDRLRLLTGGGRTAVPRQQTLRATVDWSYGLLAGRERLLLDRLSVFSGGWSLQAAEQVCSGDGIAADEILDLLTGLVDQSMVLGVAEDGRFGMLETLRDYATARLEASGRAAQVRRRHVAYYLALADRVDPQTRTPGSWTWIGGLEQEGGNLRAALGWALQDGDTDSAPGLAGPLGWYWFLGNQQEGRRWLGRLLDIAPASRTPHLARALRAYALVQAFHQPDHAERAAREALSIAEELGDTWGQAIAKLLFVLGGVQRGAVAGASRLLDEAEGALHDHGDRRGEAIAWWLRLAVAGHLGDLAAAIEAGQRSLQRFRELGDTWGVAGVLTELAEQTCRTGEFREAVAMYEESLVLARSRQLRYAEQDGLVRLGNLLTRLGDLDQAAGLLHDALALAHQIGYPMGAAASCNGMGLLARRRGDLQLATTYHQQAVAIYQELGGLAGRGGLPGLVQSLACLGACRQLLGDLAGAARCYREALAVAGEHGAPLPIACCIEGLAGVAAAMGDAEQAARLLGTAATVRERAGAPHGEREPGDADSASVSARRALGDEAFRRAHQQGRTLDLEGVQAHIPV